MGPDPRVPGKRFNDGKCDPAGRFWAGTMDFDENWKGLGTLYRVDTDRSFHEMVKDVALSNGLAWSSDQKTMYYIDSITGSVDAFDYNVDTGSISNRRAVIRVPMEEANPDGMCIDAEDKLWVAHVRAGRIVRYDPETGEVLAIVEVPASKTTSCAFGGPDLNQLYITTGRFMMEEADLEKEPLSGGLFMVELPVKGSPVPKFGG